MTSLRSKGIEVELRYDLGSSRFKNKKTQENIKNDNEEEDINDDSIQGTQVIDINEELDPRNIYQRYMESLNIDSFLSASVDAKLNLQELFKKVYAEGKLTLEKFLGLADQVNDGKSTGKQFLSKSKVRDIQFLNVQLKNFGSYGGEDIIYPLSNRGLVLIRGQSSDGTGADSNGSGKTTLAMSVMWCLTGSMDARLVPDGKMTDVAYDTGSLKDKRTAEVQVNGMVNGEAFKIIRRRGKKTELSFVVGNIDYTKQAIKDTQVCIDDILGISNGLLQRCCFFGQHSHTMEVSN